MQNSEKEFNNYYLDIMNKNESFPSFITDAFNIEACLSCTAAKSVHIVSDIAGNNKYVLKRVSKQHLAQSKAEWDALSSLEHPSIPKVHKWYSDDNYTYAVREYFDGMTLEAYILGNGPVRDDEAVEILLKICDLLGYLHGLKPPVIHRDIKPQNLILRPNGNIGLIDFETSRKYNQEAENDTVYMGTLQTAAPEQFGYKQTTQQTDIYALGIMLIYLKTGGYERSDTCHMSPGLKRIAEKCTEFSPNDRYKSVDDLKEQLLGKNNVSSLKRIIAAACTLLLLAVILKSILAGYSGEHEKSELPVNNTDKIAVTAGGVENESLIPEETELVSFKYKAIESAVRDALGKQTDEPLVKSELEKVYYLEIVGDLHKPVAYHELQHNYGENTLAYEGRPLNRGTVTSLEDLSLLPALREVTLMYQNITDLSGIEKLRLGRLCVAYNYISDLSPLQDMDSITFLSITCNPVKDLSPLKKLSKLGYLQICGTQVDDLSPLSDAHSLTTLDIFGMKDLDLSPLNNLKDLVEIYQ